MPSSYGSARKFGSHLSYKDKIFFHEQSKSVQLRQHLFFLGLFYLSLCCSVSLSDTHVCTTIFVGPLH